MNKKLLSFIILSTSTNLLISRPPSLPNYGNTCYLNATLQSLYSLEPFVNVLQNKQSLFKPSTFASDYVELINHFTNPIEIKPNSSKSYLESFAQINDRVMQQVAACGINAQNDSQEFLTKLLDELQNQDNFIMPKNQSSLDFITSIGDLFSSLQSRFQCPATSSLPGVNELQRGREFSPIISLEIPQQDNSIMLEELLAGFFAPEQLEIFRSYPSYSCTKQIELSSIPEIFILHTKRLQFNLQTQQSFKITTPIDVPEVLNLLPITSQNEEYQLTAVIVHQGGAAGGHYIAYVRDLIDKNWYYCSDSAITLQGNFSAASEIQQGYMFFYQKRNSTQPSPTKIRRPLPTPPQKINPLKKAFSDLANELNKLAIKINPSTKSGSWWKNIFWPSTNP